MLQQQKLMIGDSRQQMVVYMLAWIYGLIRLRDMLILKQRRILE